MLNGLSTKFDTRAPAWSGRKALVWRPGGFLTFLMTALMTAALLGAADLRVDHVSVAGADLKQMQASLAAIGIPSDFGGAHSNHATQMAVTSFPDGSYLELIALQANPDEKFVSMHYWAKQIRGNAGPTAWAVRANDVAAEATWSCRQETPTPGALL